MGFRYRKSVNMGPFRLNASKSGLGWSVGVPGARYTKMANGRNRVTASIPGTGISWVEESKKRPEPVIVEPEPEEKKEEPTGWDIFWEIVGDILKGVLIVVGIGLAVFLVVGIPILLGAMAGAKGK